MGLPSWTCAPAHTLRPDDPLGSVDRDDRRRVGMDGWRLVRALARGVAAALLGGALGAVLTRALMRVIMVVADGTLSFTWSGLAFIALFYVVFLLRRLPSARCGRAR